MTDVSESRTAMALAGPFARDLLAKGTSIGLHARVFGPGRCARTGLAGADIILRQTDDAPTFELLLLDGFAEHVWAWLEGAARGFRVAVAG